MAAGLSACGSDNVDENADLIAGKKAFAQKCSSCHVLGRANAKGTQGPNLDESFRQALSEGFGRGTIHGVVLDQISHPADVPRDSPAYMPAGLVEGKAASDVAAYVAAVAARPGKDTGKLASAVPAPGAGKPVAAKDGQLAYITKQATAPAGALRIDSKNEASIPHDIALEGGGIDEKGETVQDGGTSTINVTVKVGKYQFYCTVSGHREGGMEGTLTVK
jgi:plastocyanin